MSRSNNDGSGERAEDSREPDPVADVSGKRKVDQDSLLGKRIKTNGDIRSKDADCLKAGEDMGFLTKADCSKLTSIAETYREVLDFHSGTNFIVEFLKCNEHFECDEFKDFNSKLFDGF